jgi:hypothetical protein
MYAPKTKDAPLLLIAAIIRRQDRAAQRIVVRLCQPAVYRYMFLYSLLRFNPGRLCGVAMFLVSPAVDAQLQTTQLLPL